MEKERCITWKNLSKIDFNFYSPENPKLKNIKFDDIGDFFVDKSGKRITEKKIVINGGHFIPDLDNHDKIGKNPLKTWKLSCQLTEKLRAMDFDANLTLIINDLPFSPDERKKLKKVLPTPYKKLMHKYGLLYDHIERVLHYSKSVKEVYTEKTLANRAHKEKPLKVFESYNEFNGNYCVQSLLTYFIDISRQGADVIVFIVPKCSSHNLIKAINLFKREYKSIKFICYFYTDNCFL